MPPAQGFRLEGRVSKGARWQTVALGWIAAVVVTMLIAAWAISIVGHQLSSPVTLPKSATSDSSQAPAPSTTPRPRPSANLTPRGHRNGQGSVAAAPGAGASVNGVTSVPQADAGTGTGAGTADDGGSATSEPVRRPPDTSPPPATRPPSLVSDQRAVKTDGGTAAFTCTNTDAMSLLYATSTPGYTTDPPRFRSTSRIEVDFIGDPLDQK